MLWQATQYVPPTPRSSDGMYWVAARCATEAFSTTCAVHRGLVVVWLLLLSGRGNVNSNEAMVLEKNLKSWHLFQNETYILILYRPVPISHMTCVYTITSCFLFPKKLSVLSWVSPTHQTTSWHPKDHLLCLAKSTAAVAAFQVLQSHA